MAADEVPPESPSSGVRWKAVALPVEHGGWGLLLEPVLLGLAVAPSGAALALALAALFAFLLRQPLRLALGDWQRGARHPRTALAERLVLVYALLAAGLLVLAFLLAEHPFWPALAAGAPLAVVQLAYDARNRGRELTPEILGVLGLASLAAAIILAGGWRPAVAFAAWALLGARIVVSVLYVRARLRLARGQRPSRIPATLGHAAGLALGLGLAVAGTAPWLAVLAMGMLAVRAVHGLSPNRPAVRPQALGLQEVAYGVLNATLLAVGYRLGL